MIFLIRSAGPYLWPILLITLIIAVQAAVSAIRLSARRQRPGPRADADINAILFWGVIAAVLGFLGQWSGIYKGMNEMSQHGLSSWEALWVGVAETCLTAIAGLAILLVAAVLWFSLRSYRQRLGETSRSEASGRDSGWSRPVWEWFILDVMLLYMVLLTGSAVFSKRFVQTTSVFSWPVVGIAAVALIIALVKVRTLYLQKAEEPRRLRRGLDTLLLLATTSLGLGVLGLITELFLMARRIEADVEGTRLYSAMCLTGSSSMLMLSMQVAILIGIAWFLLHNRAHRLLQHPEPAEASLPAV